MFPRSLSRLLRRLLPLLLALSTTAPAALFWEPVPFSGPLEGFRVYRLATDGMLLYAGGSVGSSNIFVEAEAVSNDGRSWTKLPNLPFAGVSLSYAAIWQGGASKLVRVSDDRAPRDYVIATWSGMMWTAGPMLRLPGEQSPGNLVIVSGIAYLGTTSGDLWVLRSGTWSRVPSDLPIPAAVEHPAPRVAATDGAVLVVTDGGLGRLEGGRIVPADTRLAGRSVVDVAVKDGVLHAFVRTSPERAEIVRLPPSGAAAETLARVDSERGFLFFDGDDLYVAGPWNEPRLLSEGRLLSPRASTANPAYGFRVTTGDGLPVSFRGEWYATSTTVLNRARRRIVKTLPALVDVADPRYRTELLVGNHGAKDAVARLRFHPDVGLDASLAAMDVPLSAGQEVRFADAVAALRAAGGAPIKGDVTGSLSIELVDASPSAAASLHDADLVATARVFTFTNDGSYGVTLEAQPSGSGVDSGGSLSQGILPAILRDSRTRTNVAAVNAADGSAVATSLCQGVCGHGSSIAFYAPDGNRTDRFDVLLPAGGRRQWNRVAPGGTGNPGLASGSGRTSPPGGGTWDAQLVDDLLVYAVLNDETTNDGVTLPLQIPSRDALRDTLFLPVLGDFGGVPGVRYRSMLLLAQSPDVTADGEVLTFLFRGTSANGPVAVSFDETLKAGASRVIGDVRGWLRGHSSSIPAAGDLIGTVSITGRVDTSGLAATVVVMTERDGAAGRALTSLDAAPLSRWARTSCVIPGLLENAAVRTNLALANPALPGGSSARLGVEIRRSSDGVLLATLSDVTLAPGERKQWTSVLDVAGLPGGVESYAIVTSRDAQSRFLAYGVSVDRGTGDGSILFPAHVR